MALWHLSHYCCTATKFSSSRVTCLSIILEGILCAQQHKRTTYAHPYIHIYDTIQTNEFVSEQRISVCRSEMVCIKLKCTHKFECYCVKTTIKVHSFSLLFYTSHPPRSLSGCDFSLYCSVVIASEFPPFGIISFFPWIAHQLFYEHFIS